MLTKHTDENGKNHWTDADDDSIDEDVNGDIQQATKLRGGSLPFIVTLFMGMHDEVDRDDNPKLLKSLSPNMPGHRL